MEQLLQSNAVWATQECCFGTHSKLAQHMACMGCGAPPAPGQTGPVFIAAVSSVLIAADLPMNLANNQPLAILDRLCRVPLADRDWTYSPVVDDDGKPNIMLLSPQVHSHPAIEALAQQILSQVPTITFEFQRLGWRPYPEVSLITVGRSTHTHTCGQAVTVTTLYPIGRSACCSGTT